MPRNVARQPNPPVASAPRTTPATTIASVSPPVIIDGAARSLGSIQSSGGPWQRHGRKREEQAGGQSAAWCRQGDEQIGQRDPRMAKPVDKVTPGCGAGSAVLCGGHGPVMSLTPLG